MSKQYLDKNGLPHLWGKLKAYFQQKLVSGTNIKTVNNQSLLGSGNISISGGGGSGTVTSVGIANGGGLSVSGSPVTSSGNITVGHSNSVTAGTIGSTSASSGASVSIPYATYDSNGHITGKGTHTHTVTGFVSAETDPVFLASAAAGIASSDITNWNNKAEITETNNSIEFGTWKLVWGTVYMDSNSASGSGTFTAPYYNDTTINLGDDAFGSENPYVWCAHNGTATGTRYFSAREVSASSFKIRMHSSHKNSTVFTCKWLAIGKK